MLRGLPVMLGITAFVWAPAVAWYESRREPVFHTYDAIWFAGNLILGLALGGWYLADLPTVILAVGIGASLVLRFVGGTVLRRAMRRQRSESGEPPRGEHLASLGGTGLGPERSGGDLAAEAVGPAAGDFRAAGRTFSRRCNFIAPDAVSVALDQ